MLSIEVFQYSAVAEVHNDITKSSRKALAVKKLLHLCELMIIGSGKKPI